MAAVRGTVFLADDRMSVYDRLAVLQRDISDARKKFDLFVEGNRRLIFLTLPVEPRQARGTQTSDRREGCPDRPCSFANVANPPANSSPVWNTKTNVVGFSLSCLYFTISSFMSAR